MLFGDLIEIIQDHGGDVVKFCGDALLCVFDENVIACQRCTSIAKSPAHAAVTCSLAIQAHSYSEAQLFSAIKFKIGVGTGEPVS